MNPLGTAETTCTGEPETSELFSQKANPSRGGGHHTKDEKCREVAGGGTSDKDLNGNTGDKEDSSSTGAGDIIVAEIAEGGDDISSGTEGRRNETTGGGAQNDHQDSGDDDDDEAPSPGKAVLVTIGLQPSAACGGDFPPLCEYEKLRERNIRDIEEAMKEKMKEIEEVKKDMRDNAPGVKREAG